MNFSWNKHFFFVTDFINGKITDIRIKFEADN